MSVSETPHSCHPEGARSFQGTALGSGRGASCPGPPCPPWQGRVLHTSSHSPFSRLAVEEVLLMMEDENRPVAREAVLLFNLLFNPSALQQPSHHAQHPPFQTFLPGPTDYRVFSLHTLWPPFCDGRLKHPFQKSHVFRRKGAAQTPPFTKDTRFLRALA